MVKGVARRVILVRSPDPRLFEQAIFIVREQAADTGVSPDDILAEAQRAANGYIRRHRGMGRLGRLPAPFLVALGGGLTGLLWLLVSVL